MQMKKEKGQAEEPVNGKNKPFRSINWGERLNSYICPMLLGGVLCFIVFYALYRPLAAQYTAFFMGAEFLLFMLFDLLKKRRVFGGIMYIVLMIAAVFAALSMMFDGAMSSGFMTPVSWFYGEEGSYSYRPDYLNAVFVGGGFFMISILYYFTQIRYRSLGVMLCLLFPLVIYAKRADALPDILATIMISLFLAVMVHNRRIDPAIEDKKRGVLLTNTSYIISMAIFVSVTGAITMMIEKPKYFSKLERDSSYFDYYQTQGTGSGDFDDFENESSGRNGGLSYTNNPLFYLETNGSSSEYFLRRQSYDFFGGSVWESTEKIEDYSYAYSTVIPEYAVDDVVNDLTALSDETDVFSKPEGTVINRRKARVFDETFAPRYLPAPLNTITDTAEFKDLSYRKYPASSIIRASAWGADTPPKLNDSFEYWEQSAELNAYARSVGLTGKDYLKKLEKLSNDKSLSQSAVSAAKRLKLDYESAYESYRDISRVEDRLVKLACDLTKDCKSDFEKALVLESYFEDNDFEYSLDYVPPDDSIEYFVFESKKGYCASYATAMTLMARAVDLPARYVEGFSAYEMTDTGAFLVRDGHAHAFVEVYIPCAGWLTFDPTVSDYMVIPEEEEGGFDMELFLRILSRFIVVIIVAFVIIFIVLLDRIIEGIFRIKLRFADPTKRTLMLYANVLRLIKFSTKEDYSAYTVKMLGEYLKETRTVVPEQLFDLFERTAFGGYTPTDEEFNAVYKEYLRCYKYLRRLPRPKELARLKGVPYVK